MIGPDQTPAPGSTVERSALIAVVALAGVCVLLAVGLLLVALNQRRLRQRLVLLHGDASGQDFVTVVSKHVAATQLLEARAAQLEAHVRDLRHVLSGAMQRVGVVRYDAFAEMGGHLSFSAALLDESGNGVVLSCINGRTDARMYAKGIVRAQAAQVELSPEERQAVELAMASGEPLPAGV